MIEVKTKTFG